MQRPPITRVRACGPVCVQQASLLRLHVSLLRLLLRLLVSLLRLHVLRLLVSVSLHGPARADPCACKPSASIASWALTGVPDMRMRASAHGAAACASLHKTGQAAAQRGQAAAQRGQAGVLSGCALCEEGTGGGESPM